MERPTNRQAEWCRCLVASLADAGVREVVVSPGSRSTPLVLALVAEPRLRLHDVIDERVAGFVALGMARVTGLPAALVCTSGTALAHYLPAVIEADAAGHPLLILSADRPPEARDSGANQTIRQAGLYGGFTRWAVELPVAEEMIASVRALRRVIVRAVHETMRANPGPVHVNVPARKPLEPPLLLGAGERDHAAQVDEVLATPLRAWPARMRPDPDGIATIAAAIAAAKGEGVLLVGPGVGRGDDARAAIWSLARASGFPVITEAASGLRFAPCPPDVTRIGGLDALVRAGWGIHTAVPRCVVQLGRPLVAGVGEQLAAPTGVRHVLGGHEWPDADGTAVSMLDGDPIAAATALVSALPVPPEPHYARRWAAADVQVTQAVAATVGAWSEGAALQALVAAVPRDSVLMIGNSLPVREIDWWVPPANLDLDVLVQRGVSGIDGLIAGAVGAYRMANRPTALVLGDVSLVHDLGGLQVAPTSGPPLVVLVLHNGGGRIFAQLPVATRAPAALDHFVTPHVVQFEAAAAAFGLHYRCATDTVSLTAALECALRSSGTTVIEARVPPADALMRAAALWKATA